MSSGIACDVFFLILNRLCVLLAGDAYSVPRERSGPVWWRPLVDHRGRCSGRDLDFGIVGLSAVEGEWKAFGQRMEKRKKELRRECTAQ